MLLPFPLRAGLQQSSVFWVPVGGNGGLAPPGLAGRTVPGLILPSRVMEKGGFEKKKGGGKENKSVAVLTAASPSVINVEIAVCQTFVPRPSVDLRGSRCLAITLQWK